MHMRADRTGDVVTRRWAGVAGIVSGLVGVGLSGLIAWLVAPLGSPVIAVGELIIELLPAPLVNFGKETLGYADKPILLIMVGLGVLLLCGLAGRVELRRRFAGAAVFALVAGLGLIGVSLQPGASPTAYVPTLVGLLLGYIILNTLITKLRYWRPRHGAEDVEAHSAARRSFLGWTLVVGAMATTAAVAGQLLAGAATAVNNARDRLRLPLPTQPAPPVPAGAELNIPDLTPYVSANDTFYRIDTALQVPVIDPDTWTLKINGLVDRPLEIDFATLSAKPLVEHMATLTCVSNEVGGRLAGNALWLGYPIRDLLAEAGPQEGADMVLSTSDDGWTAGTPLDVLTDPNRQALLAIGMNGEPLPIEHGFPVRMVVPGLYGYVSATKWVTELKVTTFADDEGYWTPLGWSARGPIKIASRIDTPRRATADPGTIVVAGVAWAQHTGISAVEVQIDQDAWQPAQLAEVTGPDTWRQWKFEWAATSGMHTIAVRATDSKLTLQSATFAPPAPDGATGYHSIQIKVR